MDALGMDWAPTDNPPHEAEPTDPVVREAAAAWARRMERRKPVGPKAEPATPAEPAAEQPVPSVRGGYGHAPVTYQILEEAIRKLARQERKTRNDQIDAIVDAVVKKLGDFRDALAEDGDKAAWRFQEAERRIAELEARLEKAEGSRNG